MLHLTVLPGHATLVSCIAIIRASRSLSSSFVHTFPVIEIVTNTALVPAVVRHSLCISCPSPYHWIYPFCPHLILRTNKACSTRLQHVDFLLPQYPFVPLRARLSQQCAPLRALAISSGLHRNFRPALLKSASFFEPFRL